MNIDTIKMHYARLADIFDSLWFYSDDFVDYISQAIITHLDLKPADIFVDLGCGTGIYAKKIQENISFQESIICVDMSNEMLAQIPVSNTYKTIHMDAVEFSLQPIQYDKMLIKEMIHHLDEHARATLCRGIYAQIKAQGRLLILLLPPTIDYPLFDAAITYYEQHQPHYNTVIHALEHAGFVVELRWIEYPLAIERSLYFKMVSQRYMSLLSMFSDEELVAGLQAMEETYRDQPVLQFTDRFVGIVAHKPVPAST